MTHYPSNLTESVLIYTQSVFSEFGVKKTTTTTTKNEYFVVSLFKANFTVVITSNLFCVALISILTCLEKYKTTIFIVSIR